MRGADYLAELEASKPHVVRFRESFAARLELARIRQEERRRTLPFRRPWPLPIDGHEYRRRCRGRRGRR